MIMKCPACGGELEDTGLFWKDSVVGKCNTHPGPDPWLWGYSHNKLVSLKLVRAK